MRVTGQSPGTIAVSPPGVKSEKRVSQSGHRLAVALALVEYPSPQPSGFIPVPPLLGQRCQVPQGEMAVDALVDAAELLGATQGQDPPPESLGLAGVAELT